MDFNRDGSLSCQELFRVLCPTYAAEEEREVRNKSSGNAAPYKTFYLQEREKAVEQHKLNKVNRTKSTSNFTFVGLMPGLSISGEFGRNKSSSVLPVVDESSVDQRQPEIVGSNATHELEKEEYLPRPSFVSDGRGKIKALGNAARFISSRVWSSVGSESMQSSVAPSRDDDDPNPFERNESKSDNEEETQDDPPSSLAISSHSQHQSDEKTPHDDCVEDGWIQEIID